MPDKHLNLWYAYNHDNELIENNLTRAFVLTLRSLTCATRDRILKRILAWKGGADPSLGEPLPSFATARFALQQYMDIRLSRTARLKSILVLGSALPELTECKWKPYPSTPDGWIFNEQEGYCVLLESKLGDDALGESQLRSHAAHWMDLLTADAVRRHTTAVSWFDVAAHIEALPATDASAEPHTTEQDRLLLAALLEFLGFYGYRTFHGLELDRLHRPPGVIWGDWNDRRFSHRARPCRTIHGLDLQTLRRPPGPVWGYWHGRRFSRPARPYRTFQGLELDRLRRPPGFIWGDPHVRRFPCLGHLALPPVFSLFRAR